MGKPKGTGSAWRSVGAVLAGFVAGAVLSLGTDQLLHLLKFYPPWGETTADGPLVVATAYRILFNVLGCYLTARLAPNRPMFHALVIGWLGLVLGTLAAVASWNAVPPLGPHWYAVTIALISVPCAWMGGFLYLRRSGER